MIEVMKHDFVCFMRLLVGYSLYRKRTFIDTRRVPVMPDGLS